MTSSDPLFARLRDSDPARNVDIDKVRAEALLRQVRGEIATGRPLTRDSALWSGLLQVSRWVPAAAAISVTVLVGAVFALSLRHQSPGPHTASPPQRVVGSGERALLDILGVLRRPQTARDRRALSNSGLVRLSRVFPGAGKVDVASARVATVTLWGSPVLLAIVKRPSDRQDGLDVAIGRSGGGGSPASVIEAGKYVNTQGWGASYAGGSTGVREEVVVPDGVARVTFVLSQSAADGSSGPRYAQPLRITVRVRGNVAAFEARRSGGPGATPMIWYSANGQVIKDIGNVKSAETIRPTVHPTPTAPTPLSRAAQGDPATPNPVTVTPRDGGPGTSFRIGWRLLLTGAVYQFNPTGPVGSGCFGANAMPGGLSGGTTNVRGQEYGESLRPLDGEQWCPGTYHLTVNVLSFGVGRSSLHPLPRPFGVVSFTVR